MGILKKLISTYTPYAKDAVCKRNIPTMKDLTDNAINLKPCRIIAGEIRMNSEASAIKKLQNKHNDVVNDNINKYGRVKHGVSNA